MAEYRFSGVVKLRGAGSTSSEAMAELEEAIDSALAMIGDTLYYEDSGGRERTAELAFTPVHVFMRCWSSLGSKSDTESVGSGPWPCQVVIGAGS